jgi:hypothetical protein
MYSSRSAHDTTDGPFAVAAGVLALHGLVPLGVALSLGHVGRWPVGAAALLLFAHAVALLMRRRPAWTFAVALLTLTGMTSLVLGLWALYEGYAIFRQGFGEGFGALGGFIGASMFVAAGPVGLGIGFASAWAVVRLFRHREAIDGAAGVGAWALSVVGTLASFAFLAWTGTQYFHLDLPAQDACAGGKTEACERLGKADRFSAGERRGFLRRGCELGGEDACAMLFRSDDRSPGTADPTGARDGLRRTAAEVAMAAKVCGRGKVLVCLAIGEYLLSVADVVPARQHLTGACTRLIWTCRPAALMARRYEQHELAHALEDLACQAGDGGSCAALLEQSDLPGPERARLERRACLLGSTNVCADMIEHDFPASCEYVCESTGPGMAAFVCAMCARKAARLGDHSRAAAWRESSCARGQEATCRERASQPGSDGGPPPPTGPRLSGP